MKKHLSLLFFICVFTLLNAQTKDTKIQLSTQSSDLVIEGKVLECQSFWNSDRTQIFTSNLIQLSKIFKGDIVGDKVEIITKGGQVDDQFSIVSHQTQFNTGMEGIFFCKKSKESSGLKKSENSGFRLYSNEQGFIQFYDNQFNPTASDKSFSYKNIQSEIYDNIVLSARQPIRNITPNIFERKQGLSEFALESLNPSVGIFFTFENVAFSLDYQKITFDVFVHASQNGVKFGKAKILVDYSSAVFGENVANSGNAQVTKGNVIQGTGYTLATTDAGSEKLLLDVTSPGISLNSAYTLTTVPEKFCHIELQIENIAALANIGFNKFEMTGNCWYLNNDTGKYQLFDRVEVENPIDGIKNPNEFALIDYTFDNIVVTESGSDKFLEFDVNAFSNVNWTRLAVAHAFIGYNADGFGTNPAANDRFTHTLSSQLQDLGYFSTQGDLDSHIDLNISQNQSDSLKYIVLTTTPMQLAHCKFKILDCDVNAKLNFGVEYMQLFPSYYFGQLPVPFVEYSFGEDALTSAYEQFLCIEKAPIITKIYPEKLRAGVFDILTIEGQNLKMSDTENGKFYFRNSERPNESVYSETYEIDVLSWTDTLIEIYVPSSLKGSVGSAASGKIIVENALGKQAQSDEPITIQYSIINHRDPITSEAFRISYVNADEQGGYTFKMDDELSNLNPDDCIKRALNEWACATKINWKLSPVGIFGLEESILDGNSTIILGDSLVYDSVGAAIAYAVLSGHTKECNSGMSITGYYVDDLDIVVNKYKKHNFNCDSIGGNIDEDFYRTLVHELGHEHMLMHSVHELNAVYTYSTVRSPSGDDIAGGLDAIGWSNGWTEGGNCPPKHEPKDCTTIVIENIGINYNDFQIYPNPFSTGLTLESSRELTGISTMLITDITGKTIKYSDIDFSSQKRINFDFQLLPNGIYILRIKNSDFTTSFKLIKQ